MSETTPNLGLPYLAAAQAQKHVTHNEALRRLDQLVQIAVLGAGLDEPPAEPADGDGYIVGADPQEAWEGHEGELAAWVDGAWMFFAPKGGWIAFDLAAEAALVFHDGVWRPLADHLGPLTRLGINAEADETNRLAVRSNAVLFAGVEAGDGGTGDVRFVISKEADEDTASLLFQSGFSGRAEVGLAGDTDFVFKVSADGEDWVEAIRIDTDTGLAAIAYDNTVSGLAAESVQDAIDEIDAGKQTVLGFVPREALAADRTYFVDASTGSDSNDGLASGAAFATLQKALDVCATIDFRGFTVTIQLADGTYGRGDVPVTVGQAGPENLIIQGNGGDYSAVVVHCTTSGLGAIQTKPGARCRVQYLKTTTGHAVARDLLADSGILQFGGVVFAGTGNAHIFARRGGTAEAVGNYEVTGSAARHWYAADLGVLRCAGVTVTLTGTPAFATAFAVANFLGQISGNGNTFAGSATGSRFSLSTNATMFVGTDPNAYLPGSTSGSTATGAQVV